MFRCIGYDRVAFVFRGVPAVDVDMNLQAH